MDFETLWFGIVLAGAIAYVAYRLSVARRHSEDGHAVAKQAVSDALTVVVAGLVGVGVFFGLSHVGWSILFGGAGDSSSANVRLIVVVVVALAALFGLPLATLAIVVRVRRRRREPFGR